jgi:hypothetical protein
VNANTLLDLNGINHIYQKALSDTTDDPFYEKILRAVNVKPVVSERDLERIPRHQAVNSTARLAAKNGHFPMIGNFSNHWKPVRTIPQNTQNI